MRQLIILAIEGPDDQAVSVSHLGIEVPRMCDKLRATGVVINETFKPREISAAARQCVEDLAEGRGEMVRVKPERSAMEAMRSGMEMMLTVMERHERDIQLTGRVVERALTSMFEPPCDAKKNLDKANGPD